MFIKESFYSNGNIFRKESYNQTTKIENTKYFSKNGVLIVEIKNDRMTTEEVIYDLYSKKFLTLKDGKYYYIDNLYTTKIKFYYDAGSIEKEFDTLGRIHGNKKIFDIDGNLYEESFWQNGKPIGIIRMYYKNGNLMSEGHSNYYNYEGTVKVYYESGELHREESYKNGYFHGERTIYSKNGEIIERISYKNGDRIK
ncbi:MAG: hypothetical protein RR523_11835 [Cetobacterium sp.]|uniref:toxin-antitoxin system YwqK family antitoxin n=1 Tax=Cetobacterium sp. TaxID=2071632 RepID=UPI002FCB1AFE